MNQILYTGGKNKKNGMSDKSKIIIFFVILIIIFSICLIFVGSNLLMKVKNNNEIGKNPSTQNTTPTEPPVQQSDINITFEPQVGAVKALVTSNLEIQNIKYWWDEEEATVIEVNDTQYEIDIPSRHGTHDLNLEVTDIEGYTENIKQSVIGASEEELPDVTITTDGVSNYVIKAQDDVGLEKLVIVLNGETQEITVNNNEIEHTIPIPQGDSLIEVTAYNLNGLTTNKKAKITNFGG